MMEWADTVQGIAQLAAIPLSGLGIWVLVQVVRGEIPTKREHLEVRADRDKAVAALEEAQVLIRELVRQNAELIAGQKVSVEVAKHLPDAAAKVKEATEDG